MERLIVIDGIVVPMGIPAVPLCDSTPYRETESRLAVTDNGEQVVEVVLNSGNTSRMSVALTLEAALELGGRLIALANGGCAFGCNHAFH